MSSHTPSHFQIWLVVGLLWVVACLNYLDRIMITTMRDSLMASIPMKNEQFGLLTSVFLWVYGGLSPFAGFIADRVKRSHVIIASLFVWSAVTWLTGHATTFNQLLTARALMGVSEAFYLPAALALIADYHHGSTRSLATGIHMSGIMVGSGMGGIGGWIAEKQHWSHAFDLFGLFGVVYAVLLFAVLRDAPDRKAKQNANEQPAFAKAVGDLFATPSFLFIALYWGLLGLAGWAISGWLPTYLNEHFKLGQGVAGLSATGYVQAGAVVGTILGGAVADQWSRRHSRGRIFATCLGLCVAAPGIFLAAKADVLGVAICGLLLYGVARAFTDANTMPILCQVVSERYRATGYGILNFFACIVGGITIWAGGRLHDAQVSLSTMLVAAAVAIIGSAGLLFLVNPATAPVAKISDEVVSKS